MTPNAWDLLGAVRLTAFMQELQDVRTVPADLRFLGRTPIVPAEDSEIMARFTGYVTIADLIADDQQAVTYLNTKLTFESTAIPNIKHGSPLTQAMLNKLMMLRSGNALPSDMGIFTDYRNRTADALLLGVRQRMEALLVAMAIDGLSYNRLGIIMDNVSWGMPSDLKVTVGDDWDDPTNATPVDDIWGVLLIARTRYGQVYNRITMGTQAFRYMIATDEFQAKAKAILPQNITFANLPMANLNAMQTLAESVLGLTIELYDSRYWTQAPDGSLSSAPYLPIVKVVLSNTADDNDATAFDFANGVTTESVVGSLAPVNIVGSFGGPARGPISFATANPSLNPPNITLWGVARGFPRKHRRQATAVLTVGSFSDSIDPSASF